MMKPKLLIPLAVGVALGLALIAALAQVFGGYRFHGMLMRSDERAYNFTLTSATTGEPVALSDYRGQAVLLYFGYTTCPDICPATLTDMTRAEQLLGNLADDLQMVFVTVDPERDTPEKISDYISYFSPEMVGLVSDPETLQATAFQFGVVYEKQQVGSSAGYLVDHTATIMLIDRDGYLRVVFPFGMTPEEMADDIRYVLTH